MTWPIVEPEPGCEEELKYVTIKGVGWIGPIETRPFAFNLAMPWDYIWRKESDEQA